MRMKEESEKKLTQYSILKNWDFLASAPIAPWQTEREKVEAVTDFLCLGPKITADGDYSHEIKKCLLLGRKAITNLDSVFKSRDITLPLKAHIVYDLPSGQYVARAVS